MNNILDVLKFNMDRIDGYIEKADNKASFLLALNGVIIGIIFSQLQYLMNFISLNQFKVGVFVFVLIIFLFYILSIIYALNVLLPRNSKDSDTYKSILYYRDISRMNKSEYKQMLISLDDDEKLLDELCEQVIQISIICDKKMENVKKSTILFMISSGVTIATVILYSIQYIFI